MKYNVKRRWQIIIKQMSLLIILTNLMPACFADNKTAEKITEKTVNETLLKTEVECKSGTDTVAFIPNYINHSWYLSSADEQQKQSKKKYMLALNLNTQLQGRASYGILLKWIAQTKKDIACKITYRKNNETNTIDQVLVLSNLEMQSLSESINNYGDINLTIDIGLQSNQGKAMIDGIAIK